MKEQKQCVLYDRVCIGCGECDRCDLDPNKICNNCMKCIRGNEDYRAIAVDDIELESEYLRKHGNDVSEK